MSVVMGRFGFGCGRGMAGASVLKNCPSYHDINERNLIYMRYIYNKGCSLLN